MSARYRAASSDARRACAFRVLSVMPAPGAYDGSVNEPGAAGTSTWDSGHEWLWRRMRRFRRIGVALLVVGLGGGYGLGRSGRAPSPHSPSPPSQSTADAGTLTASGVIDPVAVRANTAESPAAIGVNNAAPRLTLDDRPSRGPADAAITIVEFSDFQCPFCFRHEKEVVPKLMDPNGKYGAKIRYIVKSLPLAEHPLARGAAEAAECAQLLGKYWQYHDRLFDHQDELDPVSLRAHARAVGLDGARFDQCLDSRTGSPRVDRDLQEAANFGIKGTPTFFVNGVRIPGAQPLALFETVIDHLLAGQPIQLVDH